MTTNTRFLAVFDGIKDMVQPDVIDFWMRKAHPLWSLSQGLGVLVEKRMVHPQMVAWRIKPNRHVPMWLAGQHVRLTAQINGVRIHRNYSPSRLSDDPDHLWISVQRVTDGKMSTWLHDQARVGDIVELDQVSGEMYAHPSNQPMLLLAAGSGITPMISLIRARRVQHGQAAMKLIYWVRTAADIAFLDELQQHARDDESFSFQIILTQAQPHVASARIDAHQIAQMAERLEHYVVYACGPAGFVHAAQQLSAQAQRFVGEAFSLPANSHNVDGMVNVWLSRQQRQIQIPRQQAILPALEAQGLTPAYGCRMGVCRQCVCAKTAGTTVDLLSAVPQSEPVAALKICVSRAQTDLCLDL